jgi:phenylalanine-4-hydroxylase
MTKRPFFQFDDTAHQTWRRLWEHQWPLAQRYASQLWLDGVDQIGLTGDGIPDFQTMDQVLQDLVGWELVSTDVQFSDGQEWFEHLAERKFLITEYIRDQSDLDYTPLPDIWHDAFGHLPFMANQRYADYIEHFAHHALKFTKEQRKSLGSLWWYTIEFGFMMEQGEMKSFGTGLLSSHGEIQKAYSDAVEKVPYSLAAFEEIDPSPHAMHHKLFILQDMEQLEQSVDDWVTKHQDLIQT